MAKTLLTYVSSRQCILLLVCVVAFMQQVDAKKATILTDANFEHDTQATSGSTTGDWFVNFCDKKKSKECRAVEPLWDELADRLYGRVSVASVDLDKNPELQRRFNIVNVPTMYLLKRGRFYKFQGEYDLDQLQSFALDNYDSAVHKGAIPVENSALAKVWKMILQEIEDNGGVLNVILMKDDQGNLNYPAMFIVFFIPLLTFIGICFMCSKGDYGDEAEEEDASQAALGKSKQGEVKAGKSKGSKKQQESKKKNQ